MEKIVSQSLSYNENAVLCKGTNGFFFRGFLNGIEIAVKRVQLANVQKEPTQKKEEEGLSSLNHRNVIKLLHVEQDSTFRYSIYLRPLLSPTFFFYNFI